MIRKATPADAEPFSELMSQLSEKPCIPGWTKKALEKISANQDYCLLVEEEEGALTGTAMGIRCIDTVGDDLCFLLIENVVVDEGHRRQGIATCLLAALEAFGRQHNCAYAILVSGEARREAHALYAHAGFNQGVKGFKKLL